MAPVLLNFLYSQLFVGLPKPTGTLTGKTALVTGSNIGLGKEAARHFVSLGASTVILAVRSASKGAAAKEDILKTTKATADVVQVWELDMSSYDSVLAFAARCDKELERVDVAVLNAGVAKGKFEMAEKDESTITINVVSTFLLALALLPKMKATAQTFDTRPNLEIVSSEVHMFTAFKERSAPQGGLFDLLGQDTGKVDMADRYQISKLLEVLFVRAMVQRRSSLQIPVTINYVNPGLCHSALSRDASFVLEIGKFLLARSTEVGSRTLVHAAMQGGVAHGEYMSDCKITQPSKFVLSEEGYVWQERVWDELTKKLEAIKPGVTSNL
ncbi:retinol dehydrogenase 12 [Polyplosphaeria fusca]|uniref:Retinol dehydrogenase 12 n=1 Tax=Polyplosphaeria fusca TaxID=682080 RepID=A0A9P4QPH8_9PLEO|nr:retinol dehydrogenase 12 [Polyplosphaeria fusca]